VILIYFVALTSLAPTPRHIPLHTHEHAHSSLATACARTRRRTYTFTHTRVCTWSFRYARAPTIHTHTRVPLAHTIERLNINAWIHTRAHALTHSQHDQPAYTNHTRSNVYERCISALRFHAFCLVRSFYTRSCPIVSQHPIFLQQYALKPV